MSSNQNILTRGRSLWLGSQLKSTGTWQSSKRQTKGANNVPETSHVISRKFINQIAGHQCNQI